jgi:predicted NAD-dependent protein-ADP-ribosyltransferase YbiA (DUF1768 family)
MQSTTVPAGSVPPVEDCKWYAFLVAVRCKKESSHDQLLALLPREYSQRLVDSELWRLHDWKYPCLRLYDRLEEEYTASNRMKQREFIDMIENHPEIVSCVIQCRMLTQKIYMDRRRQSKRSAKFKLARRRCQDRITSITRSIRETYHWPKQSGLLLVLVKEIGLDRLRRHRGLVLCHECNRGVVTQRDSGNRPVCDRCRSKANLFACPRVTDREAQSDWQRATKGQLGSLVSLEGKRKRSLPSLEGKRKKAKQAHEQSLPLHTGKEIVQFCPRSKKAIACLSSCVEAAVTVNGRQYPTAEHAYQAQKIKNGDARKRFEVGGDLSSWAAVSTVWPASSQVGQKLAYWRKRKMLGNVALMATKPNRAHTLGIEMKKPHTFHTVDDAAAVWLPILRSKFEVPALREKLVATNSAYLVEFNRGAKKKTLRWQGLVDKDTGELHGKNWMGLLMMQLRTELT